MPEFKYRIHYSRCWPLLAAPPCLPPYRGAVVLDVVQLPAGHLVVAHVPVALAPEEEQPRVAVQEGEEAPGPAPQEGSADEAEAGELLTKPKRRKSLGGMGLACYLKLSGQSESPGSRGPLVEHDLLFRLLHGAAVPDVDLALRLLREARGEQEVVVAAEAALRGLGPPREEQPGQQSGNTTPRCMR